MISPRRRTCLIAATIGLSMAVLSTSAFAASGGETDTPGDASNVTTVPLTETPRAGSYAIDPPEATSSTPDVNAEWTAIDDMPVGAQDTAAAWLDGRSYVIGGYSRELLHATDVVYTYDVTAAKWGRVADLPQALMQSRAAVVDGKIYVFGGWTNTDTVDTVYVYDPGTDSWSPAASMPAPRAAGGIAVVDGDVYIVGGCSSTDPSVCTPAANLWRYDTATDTWKELADYPIPFAHGACGGVDGTPVCAGGLTIEDDTFPVATTYAYDGDGWQQRADLPGSLWGMATATANGTLIVSNGVVNGTAMTNRTLGYDAADDTWNQLPAAGHTAFRGSMSCGLVKAGGRNGLTVATAETLDGYTDCSS